MFGGIENSFIVKKAKNFNNDERYETGYKWTDKHQERSPLRLVSGHSTLIQLLSIIVIFLKYIRVKKQLD